MIALFAFAFGLIVGIAFSYYVVVVIGETIQSEIDANANDSVFETDYSAN